MSNALEKGKEKVKEATARWSTIPRRVAVSLVHILMGGQGRPTAKEESQDGHVLFLCSHSIRSDKLRQQNLTHALSKGQDSRSRFSFQNSVAPDCGDSFSCSSVRMNAMHHARVSPVRE